MLEKIKSSRKRNYKLEQGDGVQEAEWTCKFENSCGINYKCFTVKVFWEYCHHCGVAVSAKIDSGLVQMKLLTIICANNLIRLLNSINNEVNV